ncbi:MAG: hypothetical protein ACK4P4_23695 [Allorhizobium sp.]
MSRVAENIGLYATTVAVFAIGISAFMLLAPIDRTVIPYQNKLENGCYMLFSKAVLAQPGCFELQEDVAFENNDDYFLLIKSSDVRVDLKGKSVTGPGQSSTQSGIYIEGGDNISISNGSIGGFMFGIRGEPSVAGEPLKYVQLKDLKVTNASLIGVKLIANEVSIDNTDVEAPGDSENRIHDYIFDVSIEAQTCFYNNGKRRKPLGRPADGSRVRLPDHCVAER